MGVITPTTLLQRLGAWLREPDFTTHSPAAGSDDLEWATTQLDVAKDAAIEASIDIIKWQWDAWQDLVAAVNDVGIVVHLNQEASGELDEMIARLKASITVAREVLDIDESKLKGVTNDR